MSEHRIVVHMGIPKTGSSSLQRFLALNRENLNYHGYDYPDLNHSFSSGMAYTGRWMNSGRLYHANADRERFVEYLDELDSYYNKWNIILSDEGIFGEGREFLEILNERYKNIYLIVYLRRQDTQIESEYAQRIKASIVHPEWVNDGDDVISLNDFIGKTINGNTDLTELLHYSFNLDNFSKLFGEKNISVNLFEDAVKNGLYKSFINAIGISYEGFVDTDSVNISRTALETEVKRRLNLFVRKYPTSIYKTCNEVYRNKILGE